MPVIEVQRDSATRTPVQPRANQTDLELVDELVQKHGAGSVFVDGRRYSEVVKELEAAATVAVEKLVPADDDAALVERAAEAAHEANRAYCESIGDDSQLPWAEAPDWQKDSARNGVRFVIANPDAGDSAQHDNWVAQKVADGWVYGEVKDAEAKTHPCLVPFDELPDQQQEKDKIFRETVLAAITEPTKGGDK